MMMLEITPEKQGDPDNAAKTWIALSFRSSIESNPT
ncbi:hypothetical protein ACVWXL_001404 [Bradyrhizobium sp. GM22.5]|jgi:hypothetical protein